jgi:N-acetylglutamate synthase-like GNAT family acetyltransferase
MNEALAISVRIASLADLDAVTALVEVSYSQLLAASYDRDLLGRALPHLTRANRTLLASRTYYVAEREPGDLVGCGGWTTASPVSGEIIGGEAHIRLFATHPVWVRRGVGAALLARCIRDAQAHGVRKLNCFSTLNAEGFYRAYGFDSVRPIEVAMGPDLTLPGVLMTRALA